MAPGWRLWPAGMRVHHRFARVFIELYGVPPQYFGLLFGANALSLIVCSQISARLHVPIRRACCSAAR